MDPETATQTPGANSLEADTASLETRDGLRLECMRYRVDEPKARVLLVHGFGEHQDRYDHVVTALTGGGYECCLFDLRGHGASGGPRGHVPSFEAYREDLSRVAAWAQSEGELASALVAHSLGGLITLSALLHGKVSCRVVALSSPFLAPAFEISSLAKLGLRLGGKLLPRASFPAGLDASGLSRDPAVVKAYLEDPRVLDRVSLAWGLAVLEAQEEVFARASELTLPCLFQLGGADPIADPARGKAVFDKLRSSHKRLEIYQGFLHEIFNEIGREEVLSDLLAWLNESFS